VVFMTGEHVSYSHSESATYICRLEEVLVTPVKINRKAAEFFESLGLMVMPK